MAVATIKELKLAQALHKHCFVKLYSEEFLYSLWKLINNIVAIDLITKHNFLLGAKQQEIRKITLKRENWQGTKFVGIVLENGRIIIFIRPSPSGPSIYKCNKVRNESLDKTRYEKIVLSRSSPFLCWLVLPPRETLYRIEKTRHGPEGTAKQVKINLIKRWTIKVIDWMCPRESRSRSEGKHMMISWVRWFSFAFFLIFGQSVKQWLMGGPKFFSF